MTFEHRLPSPAEPTRVVVLGARGFVGSALVRDLEGSGVPTLGLGSADLDLSAADAAAALAAKLRPEDSVVFLSTLTPDRGRDLATCMRNLRMGEAVADAVQKQAVAHLLLMSSDAIYSYETGVLSETTPATPMDIYGAMHRTRELMLQQCFRGPLAILRSTLIYGAKDPHNSYGPNRFRRMAEKDRRIVLGGKGEETRDHMLVDDAVAMIREVLRHRSHGLMNLASGQSASFDQVARLIAALYDPPAEVVHTAQQSAVTHRHFDPALRRRAFPQFRFTPLAEGLARVHREAGRA